MRSIAASLIAFYLLSMVTSSVSQEWRDEFESVCSKTDIAVSLTKEEVKLLIDRCDRLRPTIEGLPDETQRKIYLKRLQMCRDLFDYVLKTKTGH